MWGCVRKSLKGAPDEGVCTIVFAGCLQVGCGQRSTSFLNGHDHVAICRVLTLTGAPGPGYFRSDFPHVVCSQSCFVTLLVLHILTHDTRQTTPRFFPNIFCHFSFNAPVGGMPNVSLTQNSPLYYQREGLFVSETQSLVWELCLIHLVSFSP